MQKPDISIGKVADGGKEEKTPEVKMSHVVKLEKKDWRNIL
jgi:hypothetical protein